MLLGGKGGCQQCSCVPCNACTATCTDPHTGDAFEVVYTRYFEGVEAGNTTDGYLTATGDSDTSDPYDGMDGTGPWYQRVSGGFTLGGASPGTRFPCSVQVSFWRNNYVLGPATIPPPAGTLTENIIEVIVDSGALVAPDGRVITPADGAVTVSSVPLVSVGGDASESDPRSGGGTVSFSSQCWNVETVFTIRATIRWNTQKRQHVLYGKVRECYEEGTPCATACSGNPPPDVIYLEISNFGGTVPDSPYTVNGTYVLDRVPGFCDLWRANWPDDCAGFTGARVELIEVSNGGGIFMLHRTLINGGLCVNLTMTASGVGVICGTGVIDSGAGSSYFEGVYNGTFDWEVSA